MSSRVAMMKAERKNPAVLQLKILKIRNGRNQSLVFVFEGPEDVGVYEEWIRQINPELRYEPVAGDGKEQLVNLCRQINAGAHRSDYKNVYFFVDRDFDVAHDCGSNLFELDAYSVENLLCTEAVLESLLRDEFRLAGSIDEIERAKNLFGRMKNCLAEVCEEVDMELFLARRTKTRISKKPRKCTDFASIQLDSSAKLFVNVGDVVELEDSLPVEQLASLRLEFAGLSRDLRQRGKYQLDAFYRWLQLAHDDIKSANSIIAPMLNVKVKAEPHQIAMRRFASASGAPEGLRAYINKCTLAC